MRWRNEVAEVDGDVDKLNDNLVGTVINVAQDLGMRVRVRQTSGVIFRNKPWFDGNCRETKRSMGVAFGYLHENDT